MIINPPNLSLSPRAREFLEKRVTTGHSSRISEMHIVSIMIYCFAYRFTADDGEETEVDVNCYTMAGIWPNKLRDEVIIDIAPGKVFLIRVHPLFSDNDRYNFDLTDPENGFFQIT